jgi:hypothetical protein
MSPHRRISLTPSPRVPSPPAPLPVRWERGVLTSGGVAGSANGHTPAADGPDTRWSMDRHGTGRLVASVEQKPTASTPLDAGGVASEELPAEATPLAAAGMASEEIATSGIDAMRRRWGDVVRTRPGRVDATRPPGGTTAKPTRTRNRLSLRLHRVSGTTRDGLLAADEESRRGGAEAARGRAQTTWCACSTYKEPFGAAKCATLRNIERSYAENALVLPAEQR